jgi:transposase
LQSEETWMELHALHRHGWSIADLAREFGLNWRTVKKYVTEQEVPRYRPRARPAGLTAAQLAHVERRLTACPDLRVTVLLRELADGYGYTGSYASLRRRMVVLRPATAAEPVLRFETDPGEQTQGDWANLGSWPLGAGTADLFAFVAILGCSRMVAVRFATDKTRSTTLRSIVRCTDDLGGATADFLHDRDTALMAGVRADGAPIYAPEWLDVAALLGTHPRACRPYRAQTKGKVERVIRELREDFLAWLAGQVLPEHPTLAWYDGQARAWALGVHAKRRHRTTGRVIGEAWEAERPLLVPVSPRLVARMEGSDTLVPLPTPASARQTTAAAGETVEVRPLAVYAELAR